ncbi:MAG: hypothetical protein SCH71_07090 [Desulfobulbaceae bacterium]|nr:hypothetical protein [Desulfobulbaceae bacterium]
MNSCLTIGGASCIELRCHKPGGVSGMSGMQTVTGRLLMVQESRFRIAAAGGRVFLLTLSHSADADETDLLDYFESNTPLVVKFRGEPNAGSGIVESIIPYRQD